jgi:hypothetical protein
MAHPDTRFGLPSRSPTKCLQFWDAECKTRSVVRPVRCLRCTGGVMIVRGNTKETSRKTCSNVANLKWLHQILNPKDYAVANQHLATWAMEYLTLYLSKTESSTLRFHVLSQRTFQNFSFFWDLTNVVLNIHTHFRWIDAQWYTVSIPTSTCVLTFCYGSCRFHQAEERKT